MQHDGTSGARLGKAVGRHYGDLVRRSPLKQASRLHRTSVHLCAVIRRIQAKFNCVFSLRAYLYRTVANRSKLELQWQTSTPRVSNSIPMSISDRLPVEILQAEVLDWWETQHETVSSGLDEKLLELLNRLDGEIEAMPIRAFLRKGKYHAERLEPIVQDFLEKYYAEFTNELDEAFQRSVANVEAESATETINAWSYKEMATAGGAAVATIAPLAALPFLTGGLVTSGTILLGFTVSPPALIPTATVAAATGLIVAAAGPTVRKKAVKKLKSNFKEVTFNKARTRVIGDPLKPEIGSLKGSLLNDLTNVALRRIERLA